MILKKKDEKDHWYYGSSFVYPQKKGFVHYNVIKFIGEKEGKKDFKKKDNVEKASTLLVNHKDMVKGTKNAPYCTPYLEDSLGKEIIQTALDICKISLKEAFEKEEEQHFLIMEVLRKMFTDLQLLIKDKTQTTRLLIQARLAKALEELGCDLTILKTKGKDKGKVPDENNSTPIDLYKMHVEKQNIIDKSQREQKKRITQKLLQNQMKQGERGVFGLRREKKEETTTTTETQDISALAFDSETQLLLNVTSATLKFEDPVFLNFSIFQQKENPKFLTEPFKIEVNGKLEKHLSCIFRDLEKKDWKNNLFLVVRAFRYGGQKMDAKKKDSLPTKRPIGVGVFEFSYNIIQGLLDGMSISDSISLYQVKEETNFHKLHTELISEASKGPNINLQDLQGFEKVTDPVGIQLSLFEGIYETVMENDTLPENLITVWPMNFMDVIQPTYERNDIYVHLDNLSIKNLSEGFLKSDSGFQNIMCTVKVMIENDDRSVKLLPKCIYQWASADDSFVDIYESAVYHHVANPHYDEIFKVNIDTNDLNKAMVVFSFYHIQSSKTTKDSKHLMVPFAIATLPFTRNGMLFPKDLKATKDERQILNVYNYATYKKEIEQSVFEFDRILSRDPEKKKNKSTFEIDVKVVSTKVTTDENCKNLISWEKVIEQGVSISDILDKYVFVSKVDQIIFLKESLTAFLSILDKKGDQQGIPEKILGVLNKVILNTTKSSDLAFRSLMESLINNIKSTTVWRYLKNLLSTYVSNFKGLKDYEITLLSDSFKVMDYYFQMIVVSRNLYEMEEKKKDNFNQELFEKERKEYQDSIVRILRGINEIIPDNSSNSIRCSGYILKNTAFWDLLVQIFADELVGKFFSEFLKSIPSPTAKNKNIMESKLQIINQIAKGELIHRDKAREAVIGQILKELHTHFDEFYKPSAKKDKFDREKERETSYKMLGICVSIIGNLFSSLQEIKFANPKLNQSILNDLFIISYKCITLIDTVMDHLKTEIGTLNEEEKNESHSFEQEKDESKKKEKKKTILICQQNIKSGEKIQSDIVSIHISFLHLLNDDVLEFLLTNEVKEIKEPKEFKDPGKELNKEQSSKHILPRESFVNVPVNVTKEVEESNELILNFTVQDIMNSVIFIEKNRHFIPIFWNSYHGFTYNVIFDTFKYLSEWLLKLIKKDRFDFDLWNDYFNLVLDFIISEKLKSELWPCYKKKKVIDTRGDFRIKSIQLLINFWKGIDKYQEKFTPRMIDSAFPHLASLPNDEFLQKILELYHFILLTEFLHQNKLSSCEGVLQRNLALCALTQEKVDVIITKFEQLIQKEGILGELGQNFINGLRKLMEYKKEVESVKDSEEDRKSEAFIGVMKYFLKHNNFDLYFSYAHNLSQTQKNLGNFIEAAQCLLLHAERLSFHSSIIKDKFNDNYKEQKECERKEKLYLEAIELFEKGNDIENAITLCKELQKYYEEVTNDYDKLCSIVDRMHKNYQRMKEKEKTNKKKFYPSYFYVGKHGTAWGEEEGEYIYRGSVLENHVDFAQRIKKVQGNHEATQVNSKPTKDKLEDGKKYIEVYTIFPTYEAEVNNVNVKVNRNIHPKILSYDVSSHVNIFYKDRRYDIFRDRTGAKKLPKEYNDYKNLHREITYYYVKDKFPHVQRRQKVEKAEIVVFSPLQNATRDVEDKVREITTMLYFFYNDTKPDINQMSMALSGVLDAPVNGGVRNYIRAFFSTKYISKADEITKSHLYRFRSTLNDQLHITKESLIIWRKTLNQTKQTGSLGLVDHLDKKWIEMEEKIKALNVLDLEMKTIIENDVDSDEELLKSMDIEKKEEKKEQPMTPQPMNLNPNQSGTSLPVTPNLNIKDLQIKDPLSTPEPLIIPKDSFNEKMKSPRKQSVGESTNPDLSSSSDSKNNTPNSSLRGSSVLEGTPIDTKIIITESEKTESTDKTPKKRLSIGNLLKNKEPQFQEKLTTPQPETSKDKEIKKKASVFGFFGGRKEQ